jgi:hypothetical protein
MTDDRQLTGIKKGAAQQHVLAAPYLYELSFPCRLFLLPAPWIYQSGCMHVPDDVAWQFGLEALRQQVLVVALADAQAAKRPQATEVQIGERSSISKIAVGKNFRQQLGNQGIQLGD